MEKAIKHRLQEEVIKTNRNDQPPIIRRPHSVDRDRNDGDSIRIYLSYDYLPMQNIALIMKSLNELYETVYEALYKEKVPFEEKLSLAFAETGNSFEFLSKVWDSIKPTKKQALVFIIVAGIISAPFGYQQYKKQQATRYQVEASILQTQAETRKTNAEAEGIELDNVLKRQNLQQDSLDRINQEHIRRKIIRKKRTIQKQVNAHPINIFVVNGAIIVNKTGQ